MINLRSIFQEKFIEVETKCRFEGFNEGLQKQISWVIRLLTCKVGNLSSELLIKNRSLTIEKIEELGEALLDFTSPQDLITWLDTH